MSSYVMEAENLYKKYGDLEIIKGASLKIKEGEKVAIVGKSGSGKSTLLNLLALLDRKDGGKIYYSGKDSDDFKDEEIVRLRKGVISFVFQNSLLFEDFSAKENILLTLSISGIGKKEAEERSESLLSLVGLKDRMNHRPRELSGGERQRVAIARAVSTSSSLIFFDEPTGSLDEEAKKSVEDLLFSSSLLEKKAALIVTHDKDLKDRADTAYLLRGGRLEKI